MMRNLIKGSPVLGLLLTAGITADGRSDLVPIGGVEGLSFGQPPQSIDRLVAADWMVPGCPLEQSYYLADVGRRNFLADVRLLWPGLLYRFLDNRLYAIQAEYPPGEGPFERLRTYLTGEYGSPSMSESWQSAPPDTYVYQYRLRSVGWYGKERSIWLTNHTEGGSIIMIDNTIADSGIRQTVEDCARARMDIGREVAASPTTHPAKE